MRNEKKFDPQDIKKIFVPDGSPENGQVTIIGGSTLFHGAPLFSLVVASRVVDMVFFSSPEPSIGEISNKLKSELYSFIWVPWSEIKSYIAKSDAVLIGPGLMRYRAEADSVNNKYHDEVTNFTKNITKDLLLTFKDKKWVIDAGSLQTLEKNWIPKNSILTPNKKEYSLLFGEEDPQLISKFYDCTILLKGVVDKVYSKGDCFLVEGGNAGLSKGGTGDTLAGLTVALYSKNSAVISACAASYIIKMSGDRLFSKYKTNFNADDLAKKVPEVLADLQK